MNLKIGQRAPDFKLSDQFRKSHSLSDYKGQWLFLYFYPKDNTPGCTKEACSIRDDFSEFKKLGVAVLGVSVDLIKSHQGFSRKYNLPFNLLSDDRKEVVKLYGVWGNKSFMGRSYQGTFRTSFLINPEGKIEKIYEKVKPEKHSQEVLADFKKIIQ